MRPARALAARLGLPIADEGLLGQALTHASWLHEHPEDAPGHNERLEFLGDAVVNLIVSEALYKRHPDEDEGDLSARRAAIVSTTGLARLGGRIDLGAEIQLGAGESTRTSRRRPSLLASSFEAVAGAIYLDLGFDAVREWLTALAEPELAAESAVLTLKSPKSRLQEETQQRTGSRPTYHLVEVSGPDHERTFRIEVHVAGEVLGVGEGPSRRVAETAAAAQAIERLHAGGRSEAMPA